MYQNKKILAIIPARAGSKGLPSKNIKVLHGKPLISWSINTAMNSKFVDKVVVSTDSQKIADIAIKEGAFIPFLRPDNLATDKTSTFSVVEHAIAFLKDRGESFDYIVVLEPTSPLTESEDVNQAIMKLISHADIADSIVGVSRIESAHPEFTTSINNHGLLEPFNANLFSNVPKRRQEIEELYFFEGSLYISTCEALITKKCFYHDKTLPFVVPKWKSLEVDDIVDFICIESIMKNKHLIKKSI
jgi:CMP-N,N'-diacetyllegionaminic acid synthase